MARSFVVLLLLAACEPPEASSLRALKAFGFTDVRLQGYAWAGCGKDDSMRTKFTAANPQGEVVNGVVCCSHTKACTVRF